MEQAIFGAGCFWGVESAFTQLSGVVETAVGYCGGNFDHPSYEDVCAGLTGHAEAVRIIYDPEKISYQALVEKFFALHDPTQLNRQGPDVGEQYRSVIFYMNHDQEEIAKTIKDELGKSGKLKRPIATQIVHAEPFWMAEDYHQKYFEKRGGGSCHI